MNSGVRRVLRMMLVVLFGTALVIALIVLPSYFIWDEFVHIIPLAIVAAGIYVAIIYYSLRLASTENPHPVAR